MVSYTITNSQFIKEMINESVNDCFVFLRKKKEFLFEIWGNVDQYLNRRYY